MPERIKKINELIKREINQLLLREINFDNTFVTITDIITSTDLKHAKIRIVTYPENQTEKVFQILEKNIYNIQQGLNKRLHRSIKYVPKIKFEIDRIENNAQKIEKLLIDDKIK
ncbi:ribosome-binding factor A [Patescibacteria group bacterium]